jgi:hypothetical protein
VPAVSVVAVVVAIGLAVAAVTVVVVAAVGPAVVVAAVAGLPGANLAGSSRLLISPGGGSARAYRHRVLQ